MMDISNPNDALRILILEDTPTDAELMVDALHEAGLKFITQRVDTKDAFQLSLETFNPNIILADCKQQPSYDGGAALQLVRETHPEMPVVMVTGALGEEKAVELLKAGAKDYVLKGGLVRLAPAVRRALADERSARSRKAAELKYRRLFEAAKDGILILDAKTGLILEANPFLLELLGYAQDELIGKALWEIGALEHIVANQDAFLTLKNKKYIRYDNLPLETKDGRSIEVEFISNVYMTGDLESIQCNIRDITERRRLQLALENNERRFRGLIENASDLVCVVDQLGCITYLSPSSEMMTGYRPDEALGRRFIDFIHPDDLPAATAILATDPSSPPVLQRVELRFRHKTGHFQVLDAIANNRVDDPALLGVIVNARDITERKKIQADVEYKNSVLSTQQEASLDGILLVDDNGKIVSHNRRFIEVMQVPEALAAAGRDEPMLQFAMQQYAEPEAFLARVRHLYAHKEETSHEEIRMKDGRTIERYSAPVVGENAKYYGRVWYFRDITVRKRIQELLEHANRALRTLSACKAALVHALTESALLDSVCRLIVEKGGYRMAWIGIAEQDQDRTIRAVKEFGDDSHYLASVRFSLADTALGRGPTGAAIRTGTVQINQNLLTNSTLAPWREAAQRCGFQASIALPIKNASASPLVLTIYAGEPDAFGHDEVVMLGELADELGYGIEAVRTRTDRDRIALENLRADAALRKSLEDSIKAIANTVELRDSYTAGHQRRVAQLAVAIARQLKLSEDTIHSIDLAASIHDLGKISIPAEILVKPSKLSNIEFQLVKGHSQAGYDILKDITFPWPIAPIVWQHHERLDGSGYPQGLVGDQILLQARIVAVADVVEAIASHRPYRAALGIDAALAEIKRGSGTAFDSAAVDACEHLFTTAGFAFS
ncbi:PAS domain S-box protein [Chromobacterium vaccinii]|uniref:PAS domain S-box protein n=1 Tax=Chromobacterium vaccinii TaxID=1108595 RepID=UPI000697DA3B|nr:PAS domain S-box protein [Chromobacterium vaccinii]